MEQTNTGAAMPAKRPQFLTVLCILTFVGVGISIITTILGFVAMQAAGAMMGGMGALGVLGFIVPIAFIIMYGVNLKHLS